ncbi:MAG: class I adenylate-forming enzyme family protein [Methylovirgula sp.]
MPFGPDSGSTLTYRELQDQSRVLCAGFQALGLVNGDKIAFLMDNGLFTAQLFLATMYGGFVSVPLNVRGGVSQLSAVVQHSDTRVVFAARKYEALAQEILDDVDKVVDVIFEDRADHLRKWRKRCPWRAGSAWRGRASHAHLYVREHGCS